MNNKQNSESDDLRARLIPKFRSVTPGEPIPEWATQSHAYHGQDVDAWFAKCEIIYFFDLIGWRPYPCENGTWTRLASPPIEIKEKSREERAVDLIRRLATVLKTQHASPGYSEVLSDAHEFLKEQEK